MSVCFELERSAFEGALLLTMSGSIDLSMADSLRAELRRILNTESPRLALEISGVRSFDSCGVLVLVTALKRAAQLGGDVVLVGSSLPVEKTLQLTKLDRVFRRFSKGEEAIAFLTRDLHEATCESGESREC